MAGKWTEVKPKGFWPGLLYELRKSIGELVDFPPILEFVDEEGVRFFFYADSIQTWSSVDANSLLKLPRVRAHLVAVDRIVKQSKARRDSVSG